MKAVISRVTHARVVVDETVVGEVHATDATGNGTGALLALVGIGVDDSPDAWETMVRKIAELRILVADDGSEVSAETLGAPILVVSQFTLMGATKKGRRPSWSAAAKGDVADQAIQKIVAGLRERGLHVETGKFGAYMQVESTNDGPFTVLVEC